MFKIDWDKLPPSTIVASAIACDLSYSGVFKSLKPDRVTNVGALAPQLDLESWILHYKHIQVFVVAGSNEPDDWWRNFQRQQRELRGGKEHSAWSRGYQQLQPLLYDNLDKDKPILTVGHSMGGAIASLALKHLFLDNLPIYGCYTEGSPRVFDKKTALTLNMAFGDRYVRVYRPLDRATWVPTFGYHHAGKPLKLRNRGIWGIPNHDSAKYMRDIKDKYKTGTYVWW